MAMPTQKYEHIKKSVYKSHTDKRKPRFYKQHLLSIYIATHDIIKREDLEKMNYNRVDYTISTYSKRTGTKFEKINYYMWRKLK